MSIAARKIQRLWRKLYQTRQKAAVKIQKCWHTHNYYFAYANDVFPVFRKTMLLRLSEDNFIDISVRSCSANTNSDSKVDHVHINATLANMKALAYLESLPRNVPFKEGDMLSLFLEDQFYKLKTKRFARSYFRGDRVLSKIKIADVSLISLFNTHLIFRVLDSS